MQFDTTEIDSSGEDGGKQRIVIARDVKEAQLFDREPSKSKHFEDCWLTLLLCEGGRHVDMVFVLVDYYCGRRRTTTTLWDQWSLSKKLLLVSE